MSGPSSLLEAGAARPESTYPELADPEFMKRFDAAVAVEQAAFDAWLAEADMAAHVNTALQAAREAKVANAALPEEENPRWTLALIEIGHRRAKPLVQALVRSGVGRVDWSTFSWDVSYRDLIKRSEFTSYAQVHAVVETFALELSRPGFEIMIWRQ